MANTTNFGWETPDDTDLVKDGAAAMRTLGNAIDTSLVDLKGGTTGQVLSKASNTDMDFTWSSVDPLTILDAKGDLISATAADSPARLAVGADGTYLQADSTTSTGLKWASVASAENFALINAGGTALTGSTTVTVSGISGKNRLWIFINGGSSANTGAFFTLRFNSDSTTKYDNVVAYQTTTGSGAMNFESDFANNSVNITKQSSTHTDTFGAMILVNGCNSAGLKVGQFIANAVGSDAVSRLGNFSYSGTSTISSVSIISSSGNFDAGTIYVYGA